MNNTLICRIAPACRLGVRGPDAATFLQGQFTNDLRRSELGGCTYGLWLNQKGRVLADSFVLARGADEFEVVSLTSPASTIRERLESYIIADDVEVTDSTDGSAGWIIAGADAKASLEKLELGSPPVGTFAVADGAFVFRARSTSGAHWYIVVGNADQAKWAAKIDALIDSGSAHQTTASDLAAGRIAVGLPEIPAELGPGDLPNEGGLEHEAISFTKGCYLGQEVMARLHNMGQVRRRLYVVEAGEGRPVLNSGAALFAGAKRVGEMRSVAASGPRPLGLAMLQTNYVAPGDKLAGCADGDADVRVLRLAEGRAW